MREVILNGISKNACEMISKCLNGKTKYEFVVSHNETDNGLCDLSIRSYKPHIHIREMEKDVSVALAKVVGVVYDSFAIV